MGDSQIARNLGEMFESATRKLNLNINLNIPTAVGGSLPASVTSFINTNYYNVETKFKTEEIIAGLESGNDNEVYTVLKHLVSRLVTYNDDNMMTIGEHDGDDGDHYELGIVGKEIVQLFPHIVKNVNSSNLKVKRLVYILLLQFNHLQADISLLSINAIQKSLVDKSAINRSLAIRCLSGIKIPAILPIVLLSLGKMMKDSSPLVRSACCISIVKCAELEIQYNMKLIGKKGSKRISPTRGKNVKVSEREYLVTSLRQESSTIGQLYNFLDCLLSDDDPKVLSMAIIAFREIFNGCFDIWHNKISHLIDQFEFLESDAKVAFLDIMTEYIPLFYDKDVKYEEIGKLEMKVCDLFMIEMDKCVILSGVKFLIKGGSGSNNVDLSKVMIKLLQKDYQNEINDDSSITIVLETILQLLKDGIVNFSIYQMSIFIPLCDDNELIFQYKISILFELLNELNFLEIFKELKFIIDKSSADRLRKYTVLKQLNNTILKKVGMINDEQFAIIIRFFMKKLEMEKDELLVGEYITGLRQFIQTDLTFYIEILVKLVGKLIDSYNGEENGHSEKKLLLDNNAKSSIIWLLGELVISSSSNEVNGNEQVDTLLKAVPDICLLLIGQFNKEKNSSVRYQIMILITKTQIMMESLNLSKRFYQCFNYVLQLSKYDIDLDVRDASRVIAGILPNVVYTAETGLAALEIDDEEFDNVAAHSELALLMFQTRKPAPQWSEVSTVSASLPWLEVHTRGVLEAGYGAYYAELRESGFELRRHVGWARAVVTGAVSPASPTAPTASTSTSMLASLSSSSSSSRRARLQTLDDFLDGP